jgi:hypothetical protein
MQIVDKLREATEARYNNAAAVRVTGAMLTTAACLSGAKIFAKSSDSLNSLVTTSGI